MSAPPSYKELANVVNDYLTKGSEVLGVWLDAKEEGDPDRLNAYPFASKGVVGANLTYNCPKYNTTVTSRVSPNLPWCKYLPTVTYSTKFKGTSDTVEVNVAEGTVKVTAQHPVANVSCKTAVLDGGVTNLNATTCVRQNLYAGASLFYDPKRSGIRDFTAVMVRYSCPNIYKGDLMGKYSLSNGFSVHMRIPLHQYMDAAIAAERQRFIAGVQGRSPCGAQVMLNANVTEGTYTATAIRNLGDIWKLTLTMTAPFSKAGNATPPRYGFKFTHMDATE